MNIFDFLDQLWIVARGGGGIDFVRTYSAIGAAIWAILLFKVFLMEGLNVASGHQTELPKIFVKYLFVAAMFTFWPRISDLLWAGIRDTADMFFPDMGTLLDTMSGAMTRMSNQSQAQGNLTALFKLIANPGAAIAGTILNGVLVIIGMLTLFLCYCLILINIAGSLSILVMTLVIGPVFFALSFDRDFRSIAIHWFTAALSYMLLMPLYGLALRMAAAIAGSAVPMDWTGFVSTGQIAAQLLGPFMALGIVFSTNKVVSALVGGAAGGGLGSSVMGGVMGAAGMAAALIPGGGGGISKATTAAIQQAVSQAVNGSGGSGGSGNSGSGGNSPNVKASQSTP
jgi:hypothetical protein